MSLVRKALPLTFVAALALTGCTMGTSTSGGSSSSNSSNSSSSEQSSSSQTPSSSQGSSSSSSESSSSSSESPSSSDSSSNSSGSSSSGAKVKASDLPGLAAARTVRVCTVTDVSFMLGGAQYCEKDHSSINTSYTGQTVYFTGAVKYKSSSKYTYTVSKGSLSQDGTLTPSTTVPNGEPISLTVKLPVRESGTYKVVFKEDGSEISSKSVLVTVD